MNLSIYSKLITARWLRSSTLLAVTAFVLWQPAKAQTRITTADANQVSHDGNEIYTAVEHSAQFPGGINAFYAYIGKSIRYPAEARQHNVQGRVYLTFVVEKDGSLSDAKVLRGIGSGCDEEAVRVIKESPKWQPGQQNGKVVRQQYTVPIQFTLAPQPPKPGK